jgi:hypothetical protein
MADIIKPTHLSKTWAKLGDKIEPSDTKKNLGWVEEIPTYQDFNWIMNRQDTAIAHNNMHGIPVWDASTEYQAGASLVTGSNGYIYSCKVTNTGNDPVADTSETNWLSCLIPTSKSKPVVVITPTASWGNVSGTFTASIEGGVLFINGNLTGGTITDDTTIGSLPVGYRPSVGRFASSIFQTGVYTYAPCSIEAQTGGAIRIRGVTSNTNLYLSIAVPL